MEEYLVCEVAYSYGIYLHKARRFTEEEKQGLAEWFKNEGFVGIGDSTKLKYISWVDVRKVLKDKKLMAALADAQILLISFLRTNGIL